MASRLRRASAPGARRERPVAARRREARARARLMEEHGLDVGPPNWSAYPPGKRYGELYDREPASGIAAARLAGQFDCCRPQAAWHRCRLPSSRRCALGKRRSSHRRSRLWQRTQQGCGNRQGNCGRVMAGGVLPVLKHLPGHGRAAADSHHKLPVVDTDRATLEATDFAAFRPLADLPLGMTAHVVFSAIDPVAPATTSVTMVRQVICGFIGSPGPADE